MSGQQLLRRKTCLRYISCMRPLVLTAGGYLYAQVMPKDGDSDMKAIVKYGDAPGEVGLAEVNRPVCGPYDVRISVRACAVCMTDLHIIGGSYPWETGKVLGHEFSGIVTEAGAQVARWKPGDRVVSCMDGGFAPETVKREDDWIFALPDEISYDEGALLEPLCAAANSVWNRSSVSKGSSVLVEGPGTIGLFVLQLCKSLGARVMVSGTGKDADRLLLARKFGADAIVDISRESLRERSAEFISRENLRERSAEHAGRENLRERSAEFVGRKSPQERSGEFAGAPGFDTVFECSGSPAALREGLDLLRYGGELIQLGITSRPVETDFAALVCRNLKITGSIGYDKAVWPKVIELVRQGRLSVKELISARLPLDR